MISVERLKQVVSYDPDAGLFTWLQSRPGCAPGSNCGTVSPHGYRIIFIDGKPYRAARLAWFYMHGEWPSGHVDHINGNKLDDSICNLRDVSPQENARNQRLNKNSKTGVNGVRWREGRRVWEAYIRMNGRWSFLGQHRTLFDAVAARKSAESRHGFHANHGCPQ